MSHSIMKQAAREYAIQKHGDQKYGEHPYSVHLDAVALIASDYGEQAEVIAYLHDVVEDTDATLADIEARFGAFVAGCVAILTDEPGPDRKMRKQKTYKKMAEVTGELELALIVKAADRLANVSSCIDDGLADLFAVYQSEQPVFKRSAYRPGLCDPIWLKIEQVLNQSL